MRKSVLNILFALLAVATCAAQTDRRTNQVLQTVKERTAGPTIKASVKSGMDRSLILGQRPEQKGLRAPRAGTCAPLKSPERAAAQGLPRMIGTIIGGSDWTDSYQPFGVYDLPATSGGNFTKLFTGNGNVAGHLQDGIYFNNKIWMMASKFGSDWSGYDIETGERVFYRETYECEYYSVSTSIDPTTDIVYGLNYTHNGKALQIVKISFGKDPYGYDEVIITPVGTLQGSWASIAFDGNGQLWGISFTSEADGTTNVVTGSSLHRIDKTTAATTLVGETGQLPQYSSDMDFDVNTNRLYWTISTINDEGYLTEVNTTTGVATRTLDFPHNDEVTGLVVIPAAAPGTPQRVTGLSVSFDGGSLSGTATFTIPTTNTDGAAGAGTLTYTVTANDEQAGSGTCSYGQTVNAPITVANGGETTFTVTVANGDKTSKAVKTTAFVGFGTPKATAASAFWKDGFMTISWERPTETVDGGYLSPTDPFEYVISDYNTDALVGRVTDGTSYSYALAEPAVRTAYRYKVTGTSHGKSFTSATNTAYAGAETTPYSNDFNSTTSKDGYTIIDANDDGKTWTFDGSAVTCTFNKYMAMDDWLITVPIKLEAGREYPFSIDAKCLNVAYSEKLEVKAGTMPSVEAMTITIIPETTVGKNSFETLTGSLVAEETGYYYIGVHGISIKDRHTLIIDNLKLDAALPFAVPSSVQNLTVTPDPTGALTATISFDTPTTDNQGKPISSINRIELKVNEVLEKTFTNPGVGVTLSHTITVPELGEYTISVISYNDEGEGSSNVVTKYIGHDVPAIPEYLTFKEIDPGVISVEWAPVTTDIHGTVIPASEVKYDIYEINGAQIVKAIATDVTANEIKNLDLDIQEGTQTFLQLGVFAKTPVGTSQGRLSTMIPVGYPSVGFDESFASGSVSNPMMISVITGAPNWMLMIDANGIPCQDDDNGIISLIGEYNYDCGALYTGKISISHLTNPTLRFWAYNNYNPENEDPNNYNTIIVKVAEAGTENYQPLLSTTFYEVGGTVDGWHKVEVDLSAYKDKVICLYLESTTESYRYSPFDNFSIYSKVEHNVGLAGISAPTRVNTGADYSVAVTVANEGFADAEDYTVELYCDGQLLQTKKGAGIPAYESAVVEFPLTMHALAEDILTYSASVVHAPDMLNDNNTSEEITVKPILSLLPRVTDLQGTKNEGGITLSWSAPDYLGGTPASVTEDFESLTPWSEDTGDWTTYDLDKQPVSGFLDFDMPGITPGMTNASFICFDADLPSKEDAPYYAAHSGHQYMAAINRFDNGALDDWLVSPLLSGNEQVVSFWAKSYSRIFVDSFEFYYSTTGNETSDFRKIGDTTVLPQNWTVYNYELPEGARYFAVRAVSKNSFLLMLDDVTYQSGTVTTPLQLSGYNVWRDGAKLNSTLLTTPVFTDTEAPAGSHRYLVTAVYDLGESKASNVYDPTGTALTTPSVKATVSAIYNALGVKFDPGAMLAPGVYILEYTDGSISKTIIH